MRLLAGDTHTAPACAGHWSDPSRWLSRFIGLVTTLRGRHSFTPGSPTRRPGEAPGGGTARASSPSSVVAELSLEPPGCEWLLLSPWTLGGPGTTASAFPVPGRGPERLPVRPLALPHRACIREASLR